MRITLTDAFLRKLAAESGPDRVEVFDAVERSLSARVGADRRVYFYARARSSGGRGGKMIRRKLGEFGDGPGQVKLYRARSMAAEARAEIREMSPEEVSAPAQVHALTFGELVAEMIADAEAGGRSPRTVGEYRRLLATSLADLSAIPAAELDRTAVAALCRSILRRGAGVTANRALGLVRRAYRWGLGVGLVDRDPTAGLRAVYSEQPRQRFLELGEIAAIWEEFEELERPVAGALRLGILTGARRSELVGLRWRDISGDWWTVPKSKNRRPREIFLAPESLLIINEQDRRRAHVFGSIRKSGQPLHPDTLSQAAGRSRAVPDWTPHDFRRTLRTHLARMRFPHHLGGLMLGHTPRGVTETVYDQHRYRDEMAEAWLAWSELVREARLAQSSRNL